MTRREFAALNLRLTSSLTAGARMFSQQDNRRAAVVIGVDKAGNLPKLKGAASGARQIAAWLSGEGFNTTLLEDKNDSVDVKKVYDEIAKIVNSGTCEQLVIYFAGHGFISNYSEFWMLSDAPENPNEAVSLRESVELAKASALKNVVFISDACRSRADSLGTERVRGSLIFPNRSASPPSVADVDLFLATLVGDSSFEVPVNTSAPAYEGIYTACFLSAFRQPDAGMVHSINGVKVVPNNRMKSYLDREVRKRAEAVSLQLRQIPDTHVVSGDMTYIGRVSADQTPITNLVQPLTIHDVASSELQRVGIRSAAGPAVAESEMSRVKSETGYASAKTAIQNPRHSEQLAQVGGVIVKGARLRNAVSHQAVKLDILRGQAAGQADMVRVDLRPGPAASVALQFEDGGGSVIAALHGFVANVAVDKGRVADVSYVPALGSSNWSEYDYQRDRVNELRTAVATAARFGVFRIEGNGRANRQKESQQLAARIRVAKGIDPTLGIYASYAYSDAGILDQIRSIRSIMRGELQVDLFDVAMLAGTITGRNLTGDTGVFPFCPMLSEGWNLLRVKDVRVANVVNTARDHLSEALWTTFKPEGMSLLMVALSSGQLR